MAKKTNNDIIPSRIIISGIAKLNKLPIKSIITPNVAIDLNNQ